MSESSQFKHIKISADDDIVIQAGIPSQPSQDEAHEHGFASEAEPTSSMSSPSSDTAEEVAGDRVSEPIGSDGSSGSAVSKKVEKKKAEDYHETTLEDIKGSKMSSTQKVIIVLAVLAIIAFAVYSFVSG